jgi:hypothetical protein
VKEQAVPAICDGAFGAPGGLPCFGMVKEMRWVISLEALLDRLLEILF